jgi:hypothetical protein
MSTEEAATQEAQINLSIQQAQEQAGDQTPFGMDFFSANFKRFDPFPAHKTNFMTNFYYGLLGVLRPGSSKYMCYKMPQIITPRFWRWDIKYLSPNDTMLIHTDQNLFYTIAKFLYCITFKLFTFPVFQILFIVIRYIVIFLGMFGSSIVGFLIGIYNILKGIATIIGGIPKPFTGQGYIPYKPMKMTIKTDDGHTYEYAPNPILILLGLATPIFKIWDKEGDLKQKYGSGEFFFIICAISLVSAILIFIGGSSITVAIIGFAMYCFKLIGTLTDFSGGVAGEAQKNVKEAMPKNSKPKKSIPKNTI